MKVGAVFFLFFSLLNSINCIHRLFNYSTGISYIYTHWKKLFSFSFQFLAMEKEIWSRLSSSFLVPVVRSADWIGFVFFKI